MSIETELAQKYEVIIGLEIHVELLTKSKMFCGCEVTFGAEPNTKVCPVCLGLPGSLPVANAKAIEYTILTGLALNCEIAKFTQFHRKNYFYPDMPKNYQISQYDLPLCRGGYLDVEMEGYTRRVGITRVHLEEDTGKLIHVSKTGRIAEADYSLVDFNRAGTPLMEIVTKPDVRTPAEARAFVQTLRQLILSLGVSDCNMEEGSLRCDANISLRKVGEDVFGVKTEIKNMNSFRALQRALEYEVLRQEKLLEEGEKVVQETRHWDADKNITTSLRSKEEAHDYRYFADPDLVPIEPDPDWVESLRLSLPELPAARKERFIREYALPEYDAALLSSTKAVGDYFEAAVKLFPDSKTVSNWIMGELAAYLNAVGKEISESPVAPESLAEMLRMIEDGTISGKMAKEVFEEMFAGGKSPRVVVKEKGMLQISDEATITAVVEEVIVANPKAVEEYNAGKQQALGFLVGQVMKATRGQANPQLVNKILLEKIVKPNP